jgi:hypothetical protein
MRDDVLPYQPKPGKGLTFPNISIWQKWVPHEFDIVAMLANKPSLPSCAYTGEALQEEEGIW